jgi:uncharacterized membrane protein YbhN (UPF0104 family)
MKQHPFIRIVIKAAPYVFYGVLLYFLYLYIQKIDFTDFRSATFVWGFIIIASVFGLAARFWQVFIWFTLLRTLGAKDLRTHTPQLIYVYAKSWIGRYIPGGAPWILSKIYFASKHGISKSKLAVTSLLEGALQVTVVMIVALIILMFDARLNSINDDIKTFILGILVICILAVWPPIFNRLISLAYKVVRRKSIDASDLASTKTITQGALLYIVGAFFSGTALFFITKAVDPGLGYADMLYVIGVSNLAGAIGMLAVFAPSGLGVREGILLTLLSIIMPTELALVVTVASRLWDIAMDGIFFVTAKLVSIYTN